MARQPSDYSASYLISNVSPSNAPLDWRSGFGVLTFHRGRLLMPELVQVWDNDSVQFRGKIIKV